jgi:hypothetical protein
VLDRLPWALGIIDPMEKSLLNEYISNTSDPVYCFAFGVIGCGLVKV